MTTSNVKLLPLPSVLLNWPHPANHIAIRNYALACVEASTEALRAEVSQVRKAYDDRTRDYYVQGDAYDLVRERAERLEEVLRDLVCEIERNTCTHEETHRGGVLWEICDLCGAKWADDRGGKPEFQWPDCVEHAHEWLSQQSTAVDGMADFEIHAGGEYFASVFGHREQAWEEAMHYVSKISPEDGEPEVFEVTRRKVTLATQPAAVADATVTKLTKDQRSRLVEKLVADIVEGADRLSSYLWSVLKNGFKGYNNYTDQELLDAHWDAFDEDFFGLESGDDQ